MRKPFLVAAVVVLAVIIGGSALYSFLVARTQRATERIDVGIQADIKPVITDLQAGRVPTRKIEELAERPDTRSLLYRALHEMKQSELFPRQYATLEKIAESDLAAWLMHPNELDGLPDEIVLVKVIERMDSDPPGSPPKMSKFFIFKYRAHPSHWAAEKGWLAGVAGPYAKGEEPLECPSRVFSEFEAFGSKTPEEHLDQIIELTGG
ncbi:MAG TPA: hypothetical protein VFI02_11965 [Armatimonadota bacterium]|nr:hypothetical protein [Armatimonadota bacterium]